MRLKSRGLGRKELVMDFREYTATRDGNEIVISGTIREPVHWEFSIRMCQDDLPGIIKIAATKDTLGFFLRAALRRKKEAHWSVSREEHLKLVKEHAAKAAAEVDKTPAAGAKPAGRTRSASTADKVSAGDDKSVAEVESTVDSAASTATPRATSPRTAAARASTSKPSAPTRPAAADEPEAQEPTAPTRPPAQAARPRGGSGAAPAKSVSFARAPRPAPSPTPTDAAEPAAGTDGPEPAPAEPASGAAANGSSGGSTPAAPTAAELAGGKATAK